MERNTGRVLKRLCEMEYATIPCNGIFFTYSVAMCWSGIGKTGFRPRRRAKLV